jgi:hypothetical protein
MAWLKIFGTFNNQMIETYVSKGKEGKSGGISGKGGAGGMGGYSGVVRLLNFTA